MMNKQLIFLVFIAFFVKIGLAQPLQVGDGLQAMKFDHILPPDKELSLEPNKYKLTILDFWAHGCGSCIASFPKVEKLQAIFGDSVQIILINHETKDSTESLFARRNWIKKPNVKMVSQESVLHKKFAVLGVPHIVWLDENLVVKYIVHASSLNEANIRKFLNGEKLNSKANKETDKRASLFDKNYESEIQSFSYLARYISDLQFSGGDWGSKRGFSARGATVLSLIQSAFAGNGTINWSLPWKTKLNVRNPDLYRKPDNIENLEDWLYNHSYVYHLVVPKGREQDKYEIMKRDLATHFSLKFHIDTVPMEALVLKKMGNKDKLKSRGGVGFTTFRRRNESAKGVLFEDKRRVLKNQPFVYFLNTIGGLIEWTLEKPFVDDVHYDGNVDMEFDGLTLDFFTLEGLNEELERYDLKVVAEVRPTKILVIEDQ